MTSDSFKIIKQSDQDIQVQNVYRDGSPVRTVVDGTTGIIGFQARKALGGSIEAKIPNLS
jgi:hypothetical protein